MANLLTKVGYGQVEPNRIQGMLQGRVLADVAVKPADFATLGKGVQNGIVLAWHPGTSDTQVASNLKDGELTIPKSGDAIYYLIYTDVSLHSEFLSNKDFVLTTEPNSILMGREAMYHPHNNPTEAAKETVVPRGIGLTLGDVFTTNMIETSDGNLPNVDTTLKLNANGVLSTAGTIDGLEAKVVQKTTMADGQQAVKLVITKADALGAE